MIKRISKMTFLALMVVITIVLVLEMLSEPIKAKNKIHPEQVQVRYTLISSMMTDYWEEIAYGAQEEAARRGVSLKCIGFQEGSSSRYADHIEYAISCGIDGLIVSGGTKDEDTIRAIEDARAAGIPVVFTDSYGRDGLCDATVMSDNEEAGRLAADELARVTDSQSQILVVLFSATSSTQSQRFKAFEQEIKKFPNMRVTAVVEGKGDPYLIQKQVEEILEEKPEINAIFAASASASHILGRIPSLSEALGKSIHLVSFDFTQSVRDYIQNGLYDATIAQSPRQMGQIALSVLEDCRLNGLKNMGEIFTPLRVITKENIELEMMEERGEVIWSTY